jgi:hypothetical protein
MGMHNTIRVLENELDAIELAKGDVETPADSDDEAGGVSR